MTADQEFNKHLDECRQCREEPFNLCLIGDALIMNAATELSITIPVDIDRFRGHVTQLKAKRCA